MGGKKKAAKKAGGKDDEEDVFLANFVKFYKKRCTELACPVSGALKNRWLECEEEEKLDMDKFHVWDEVGWAGITAMCDALRKASYPHAKSIRLWKTFCEDEGVRAVC